MNKPSRFTLEISLFLLIILVATAVYIPALNLLLERETVDSYIYPITFQLIDHLPAWIFYQVTPGFIRPVFILSLFPDVWLYGSSAWGYRLTNLLFHFFCVAAIYLFGRVLYGRTLWLLLAVGIFALHPAVSGVVLITYARHESQALFFLLLGLTVWGIYLQHQGKKPYYPWIAGLLFFLSLMSKEIAISFPLVTVALHWALYKQEKTALKIKNVLAPYIGFILLWLGYFLIRWLCYGGLGGYKGTGQFGFQAVKSLVGLVLAPMAIYGGNRLFMGSISPLPIFYFTIGLVVILWGLKPRRKGSLYWGTIYCFLFMILSSPALLSLTWVNSSIWHIYTPLAGFVLGIAGIFHEIAARFPTRRLYLITAGVVLILLFIPALIMSIQQQRQAAEGGSNAMLRYVVQSPPDPGRTLQIWNAKSDYLAIFDSYADLARISHDKYLSPHLDLILYSAAAKGKTVIGYHLWRPYEVSLKPQEGIYRLELGGDTPSLIPIDSATFWQEVADHQRTGIMDSTMRARKKNPALK